MTGREKLIALLHSTPNVRVWPDAGEKIADHLLANGVTVQRCCYKAESVISETGLMCTACHSDIDRDADFCKYCGATVVPNCGADMRKGENG